MFPNAENVSYIALLSIVLSKFLMKTFPTPDLRSDGSRCDHMMRIGRPLIKSKFIVSRTRSAKMSKKRKKVLSNLCLTDEVNERCNFHFQQRLFHKKSPRKCTNTISFSFDRSNRFTFVLVNKWREKNIELQNSNRQSRPWAKSNGSRWASNVKIPLWIRMKGFFDALKNMIKVATSK